MIVSVPTVLVILISGVVGALLGYIARGRMEYDHGHAKGQLDACQEIIFRLAKLR